MTTANLSYGSLELALEPRMMFDAAAAATAAEVAADAQADANPPVSAEASAAVSAAVEPQPASIALHMAAASKTLMDLFIIVPPFQKKNALPGKKCLLWKDICLCNVLVLYTYLQEGV